MKILLIGDLMGKPGRWAVSQLLPDLKKTHQIDFVIANVENAAGGFGLTKEIASKVYSYGVNVLTSGNHIWDRKEIYEYLNKEPNILRPANYPARDPGKGSVVYQLKDGTKIGVLNIQGRVYMKEIDCPFRTADQEIEKLKAETNLIIVDVHAEATSEKMAGLVSGWTGIRGYRHTYSRSDRRRDHPARRDCIHHGRRDDWRTQLGHRNY